MNKKKIIGHVIIVARLALILVNALSYIFKLSYNSPKFTIWGLVVAGIGSIITHLSMK